MTIKEIFSSSFKKAKEVVTSEFNGSVNLGRKLVGDLTKPNIYRGYSNDNFVSFGDDNLFPNTIDQMYYTSPLHASIIDFQVNSAIGGGYTLEGETTADKLAIKKFERIFRINKLIKAIAIDYKMHKRFHLLITVEGGNIVKTRRLLPNQVRYNYSKSLFFVSENWETSMPRNPYETFTGTSLDGDFIYSYIDLDSSPGQDIYPLDKTVSSFNWIYLDGQSSSLQKDNIDMSIFGGIVIKRPSNFSSPKEFQKFKSDITDKQGRITPVLLLTADGVENLPQVESFPRQENDKAFEHLDARIDDKICQAHTINPVIMGIERPGSLGSGSDIKEAYPIWEANVLKPFKEEIEYITNDILSLYGIKSTLELNPFKLIKTD